MFQPWLKERGIEDVEAFVPDMAGSARGKVLPADKFGSGEMKMPEAIFGQTVSGGYVKDPNNVEDRDMVLVPDPHTLRTVPWAVDPTASVFLDCYRRDGSQVAISPTASTARPAATRNAGSPADEPAPGDGFQYLVTRTAGGIEDTPGFKSDATERLVASACP